MGLKLMYITNDPEIALYAQLAGVDRIWIDLEKNGKKERQANMNTVKSNHTINDVKTIKPLLKSAKLLVRVNPINEFSFDEINTSIEYGADIIMLPMWKSVAEVKSFIQFVSSRAKVCLLLETKEAEECIDEILNISGIDEIHIGLNDLHLDHHMDFMFELLTDGTIESLCRKIGEKGIPYGFGGIAGLGKGLLPAELIITEHYRLHSEMAILSRSFINFDQIPNRTLIKQRFIDGISEIRQFEGTLCEKPYIYFSENLNDINEKVKQIVDLTRKRGSN